MAEDIYAGRCRDCLGKQGPLRLLESPDLMQCLTQGVLLCEACHKAREQDRSEGKDPRPVGIPHDIPTATWVDLKPITMVTTGHDSKELTVLVKFRKATIPHPGLEDGGEVRIKIGDNVCWTAAGYIGQDIPAIARNPEGYAYSDAKATLRDLFGNSMTIKE